MTYQEMLDCLDGLGRFGMVLTLDRIRALLDLLGRPEERLRAVHVAGTNGKGSTVAILDAVLQAAGYTTGRWTSPHLTDFRERCVIGGRPVAPELLVEAFARVWSAVEKIKDGPAGHPTQFEVGTAMAFLLLAEAGPDLSLIEVGLGGRHDTTNVVTPLVTVITHLALDHTDRLGPDLASIAAENNGGALVRMTGEHGIWPKCLEFQLNQKQAGDFWAIRGYEFTGPSDQLQVMTNASFGVLRHLPKQMTCEKPAGEWNEFEGIADGGTVLQKVNGTVVNRATGCDVVPGKILLTSEGQEIHFRNLRLVPKP